MAIIKANFTPKSGSAFEVANIQGVDWGVERTPGPNGHVGMRGFTPGTIRISRLKSLQDGGKSENEDETIKLAAGTDQKAYFQGEVSVAPSDDEANVFQTVRWEQGYVSSLQSSVNEYGVTETMEITVTNLTVNDETFERRQR